jgi:single-strand DNA-binding protein
MTPEVRKTENEKMLVRFSVATNESYRNAAGEKVTETQWHNVVAWNKLAEIAAKYLTKGAEVAIAGKLINRNYTDKEGIKRYSTEIQATELLMLGGGTKQTSSLTLNDTDNENILPFDNESEDKVIETQES